MMSMEERMKLLVATEECNKIVDYAKMLQIKSGKLYHNSQASNSLVGALYQLYD